MTLRHAMFVAGPSGGVTAPQDARLGLAGLLTGPGIINGFVVTGSSSGPNMKYTISAGQVATQRGTLAADGLYLVANDGPVTVDSGSPAPSSGSRLDIVYVLQPNAFGSDGFGDANSDPVFGVAVGAAASVPSPPSVPAGALALYETKVPTSITDATHALYTRLAPAAGTFDGILRTSGPSVYPASPVVGQVVDDATLGGPVRWSGTAWQPLLIGDTGWQPLTSIGGSYMTPSTVAAGKAIWRIKGGVILMQGLIQPTSGSFATVSTIVLIAAGNLPAALTSTANINRLLMSSSAANAARGIIAANGSMSIVTGSVAPPYVDISGFSGYTAD